MAVYDSEKTRFAARQIRRLASSVDGDIASVIKGTAECLEDLQGRTAQAMENERLSLVKAAGDLAAELNVLALRMDRYANLLEQADEQLEQLL